MNFLLHNRIEISNGKENVYFYNQMLDSVLNQIALKKSYNDYIAIGIGDNSQQISTNHKLAQFLKSYKLETEYLQDNLQNGTLYIKKTAIIDDNYLDGQVLTEAGITDTASSNPTIFNYFQFEENNSLGITKQRGIPLVISVYIYLELSKSPNYAGLLTSGNNKFIDFLLGNGLVDDIYCARGNLLIDNSKSISREKCYGQKFPCEMNVTISSSELEVTFCGDLGIGAANEVLMLIGDEPFARILTISSSLVTSVNDDFQIKSNNTLEVDNDVFEVTSVVNNTSQSSEQNYIVGKVATKFGDKINLPFHNLFDNNSAKFVSIDGKMIFFVIDDKIYGYKNVNYSLIELDTSEINVTNIFSIQSFEDFVFVISKNSPYIVAYILQNDKFVECEIDFGNFDKFDIISNIFKCELTFSTDKKIMFGVIDKENYYGWTFYFDYDENIGEIVYDNYVCSQFKFNYVLAMYKSNFCEAMTIFLKADTLSYLCKIVYHYHDKTYQDIYSTISYYLTYDTKQIYTCDRAIIVEQLSSQKLWIYLYPAIQTINLSISGNEVDDFLSNNLKYLFQKFDDGSFKFYNLVGYNTPTEFESGLPTFVNQNKIQDFVFLNDMVLIFLDNETEKVIGLSLYENLTYLEKLSSNADSYNISYKKYQLAGSENDRVIANFMIRMTI